MPHQPPNKALIKPSHLPTRIGSALIFCAISGMFLLELAQNAVGNDGRLLDLGALPNSGEIHHDYWRLITAGFLHYNLTHLVLNILLLLVVGPFFERRAGTAWLVAIFLTTSVASCAGIVLKHLLWPSQGVSLGASGGMFGLLGAALVLAFRVPAENRLVRIRLIIVLVAALTYSVLPGISMIGHVVGLMVGVTTALVFPLNAATTVVAGTDMAQG